MIWSKNYPISQMGSKQRTHTDSFDSGIFSLLSVTRRKKKTQNDMNRKGDDCRNKGCGPFFLQ